MLFVPPGVILQDWRIPAIPWLGKHRELHLHHEFQGCTCPEHKPSAFLHWFNPVLMISAALNASLLLGLPKNERTIYRSGLSSGTLRFRKARNHPNSSFHVEIPFSAILSCSYLRWDSLTQASDTQIISQRPSTARGPHSVWEQWGMRKKQSQIRLLNQNCSGEDYPEIEISGKCRTFSMLPPSIIPDISGNYFQHLICAGVSCCYPE